MGTARMMTMAVVAIGAGAFLAISTIPAFAPYQKRRPERAAPVVSIPEANEEQANEDAYALAPSRPQAPSNDEFSLGLRNGDVVVHLPRWIEDGGELLTFGRRAWREWVEPGDDSGDDRARNGEAGYAARPQRRVDQGDYGYRSRFEQPEDRGRRADEDDEGYAPQDQWSDVQEQNSWSQPQSRRSSYAQAAGSAAVSAPAQGQGQGQERSDAAASAAERAREAARDVRAAEGADQ